MSDGSPQHALREDAQARSGREDVIASDGAVDQEGLTHICHGQVVLYSVSRFAFRLQPTRRGFVLFI